MALGFIKFLGHSRYLKTSKYTINGPYSLLKRNFKALEEILLLREY